MSFSLIEIAVVMPVMDKTEIILFYPKRLTVESRKIILNHSFQWRLPECQSVCQR